MNVKYISLSSIEYVNSDGKRTEATPGSMITTDKLDFPALLASESIREASEAEVALWEKQNPVPTAPVSVVRTPVEPNGVGGKTQESTEEGRGTGYVAADADTVGATSQGKTESTGNAETTGGPEGGTNDEPDDVEPTTTPVAKTSAPASKRKGASDLA